MNLWRRLRCRQAWAHMRHLQTSTESPQPSPLRRAFARYLSKKLPLGDERELLDDLKRDAHVGPVVAHVRSAVRRVERWVFVGVNRTLLIILATTIGAVIGVSVGSRQADKAALKE